MDKNNKIKIIAIFGKSASGKTTIMEWINRTQNNFHKITPITTRPKRENEIDGKDYHFVSQNEFYEDYYPILIEPHNFNSWWYGISIDLLRKDKVNIGIFNIYSIEQLLDRKEFQVLPVLIDCYDEKRLIRSIEREKNPDCKEICRRFLEDEKDFKKVNFKYITFNNDYDSTSDYFGILNIPEVANFISSCN